MKSIWIDERDLARRCARNEAFRDGCLDAGPLLWITVPNAVRGVPPREPDTEEGLMLDMIEHPDIIQQAMGQLTQLWKEIVDRVSAMALPAGQGTTNWTMGWSQRRFLCIGQNDFSARPALWRSRV